MERHSPQAFFAEVRRSTLPDELPFSFPKEAIVAIASDAAKVVQFQQLFEQPGNNPEVAKLIVAYLNSVADDLEEHARTADVNVDLLDRSGLPIGASATVAAIAAIAFAPVAIPVGALYLLAGGMIGMAVSGIGRTRQKRRSNANMASATKVRRLASSLKRSRDT